MFTERFVEILQFKHITPYAVAKATGIAQGLMSQYKNGIKLPTIQNLVKIADYLEVSVDYLLGRTNNPTVAENIDTEQLNSDLIMLAQEYRILLNTFKDIPASELPRIEGYVQSIKDHISAK